MSLSIQASGHSWFEESRVETRLAGRGTSKTSNCTRLTVTALPAATGRFGTSNQPTLHMSLNRFQALHTAVRVHLPSLCLFFVTPARSERLLQCRARVSRHWQYICSMTFPVRCTRPLGNVGWRPVSLSSLVGSSQNRDVDRWDARSY